MTRAAAVGPRVPRVPRVPRMQRSDHAACDGLYDAVFMP